MPLSVTAAAWVGLRFSKTAADGWTSGAASTQSIASGDGYAESTVSETNKYRMFGLSHGDSDQHYADIDYGLYLDASGTVLVYEGGTYRGSFGIYATGDVVRVAVESGVVKYKKNGTLLYTSTVTPTYPLLVDTSIYTNGGTLNNVVISGASGGSAQIQWLVTDQLGTPRMIVDQSGSLANVSRHDYLPFGEELFAGTGSRTQAQGYTLSDNVRQKFTLKERDNETGLDYFLARYYGSTQGRFISADPLCIEMGRLSDPQQLNLYSYTRNNPLVLVDPMGLDIEVTGTKQEDYRKQLQQDVSFTIQLNSKTNKVQIVDANGNVLDKKQLGALGKTLKRGEKELFKAITDTKNHVTINAIDGSKDSGVYFGASHGSVHTIAFGQTSLLDQPQNKGGMTSAQVVGHETVEGYYESQGDSQPGAHAKANKNFPGFNAAPTWDQYRIQGGNKVIGLIGNQTTVNGITERITTEFDTPVPLADFQKRKGAPYAGYPIDVKKVP